VRVVVAPDSFKGSITAASAARALADGWLAGRPLDDVRLLPLADGGEGTLDAFATAFPAAVRTELEVTGPDGRPARAQWLRLPDGSAVVELASASGLPLMARPDPLGAHTLGLGETLAAAFAAGCQAIAVALGGSASTDGGTGALRGLGARFLDGHGRPLPLGGGGLLELRRVVLDDLLPPPAGGVVLLTDVTAPLLGPTGAAAVFGPQKGASPSDVDLLDGALRRLAEVVGGHPDAAGSGAAGGTAFGLATCWEAAITPGAATVAKLVGLPDELTHADVVITGEGRFDATSLTGKVVGHVLDAASVRSRRYVVAGAVADNAPRDRADGVVSLTALAGSSAAALADPARWLTVAGEQLAAAVGDASQGRLRSGRGPASRRRP
jgi:glycerate kinase